MPVQYSKKKAPEGLGDRTAGASHSREPSSQRLIDSLTGGSTTARGCPWPVSVPKEPLEPIRCERRVPGRVLNIPMPEIGLKRAGIDPIVCKLKSVAWRNIWAWALMPSLAENGSNRDYDEIARGGDAIRRGRGG